MLGRIADFFGFITEHVNLPAVGVAIVFVIWVAVFFVISRIFRAKDKFTISYSRHSIRVRGSANIPKQAKAAGTEIHEHLITLGRIAAVSGLEAVEPETRYLEVRLRGAAIEPGNEIQVRCRIPREQPTDPFVATALAELEPTPSKLALSCVVDGFDILSPSRLDFDWNAKTDPGLIMFELRVIEGPVHTITILLFQDGALRSRVDIPDAAALLPPPIPPRLVDLDPSEYIGAAAYGPKLPAGENPDLHLVLRGIDKEIEASSPADRLAIYAEPLDRLRPTDKGSNLFESTTKYITDVYEKISGDEVVSIDDIKRELDRLGRGIRELLPSKLLDYLEDKRVKSIFLNIHPECDLPLELVLLQDESTFVHDRITVARYFAGTDPPFRSERVVREFALLVGRRDLEPGERDAIAGAGPSVITIDFYDIGMVEKALRDPQFQAFHYIGHHERCPDGLKPTSGLTLADGSTLQLGDLKRSDTKKSFKSVRPFVMLNGCETVLPGALLARRDTFAHGFMSLGSAAFVGTLWSVESRGAAEFARRFYIECRNVGKSVPQALKDARSGMLNDIPKLQDWRLQAIHLLAARAYVYFGPHDLRMSFQGLESTKR